MSTETKKRLLYLAWTAPSRRSGATLALRRYFIENKNFELFVATNGDFDEFGVPTLRLRDPAWLNRLGRTRFWRWVRNYDVLCRAGALPRELLRAAEEFQPNAVFTVADFTLSEAARRLAKRLDIPLITNFQDWWPRGQFYYQQKRPFNFIVPMLEKGFRRLCRESDLVFCTSEGMKEFRNYSAWCRDFGG